MNTTSLHPLTDRYLKMRKEQRASRKRSFLIGVMFGIAIALLWIALIKTDGPPIEIPWLIRATAPEGVDI